MTTAIHARAVLLDMDGTLVDSTAVVERVWLAWAQRHGLDGDRVLSTIHGRQAHASMAMLLPERPHEVNLRENSELLAQEITDLDGVVEIPGAAALVGALTPFPHAVVTSATVELMTARMVAAGVSVPPVVVTAEDVSRSKPDPEGFLRGASLLGAAPGDCVVLEDSAAGIAAGLAAGMTVIGVGPHAAARTATHHVADLTCIAVAPASDGVVLTLR